MPVEGEYNPLDYGNLTKHCVQELMTRGPYRLPPEREFAGAGVYALFYVGPLDCYAKIRSPDALWPIYVGKAVPSGARKGGRGKPAADKLYSAQFIRDAMPGSAATAFRGMGAEKALYGRLSEHAKSISAADNLSLDDFLCRYLVVTPLWITMAERFLIEHYRPVWNVCMEGFGNHDPGAGRYQGEITWWDALHPGRAWASKLRQTRAQNNALSRLSAFMAEYAPDPALPLSSASPEPSEDSYEPPET